MSETCSIEDCGKAASQRGLCSMHLTRFYRHGTTDPRPKQSDNPCAVTSCDRPAKAHQMCGAHAQRMRAGLPLGPPIAERVDFDSRYRVSDSGCWIWQGSVSNTGYGRIGSRYAHRVSYERSNGPIPDGLTIDHLCRTTLCVNPDHLEPVTHRENVLRGMSPGAIAYRARRGLG